MSPFQPKSKAYEVTIDESADAKAVLADVVHDCALAFNCRAIESEDENYSTGCTYFIRGNEEPRTGLESLAQQIFKLHSRGKAFNLALSGAEWWTQVIDERDDIGIHWDRDYGMEEQTGTHVYPYCATVTYFAEKGSPTIIFDKEGTFNHTYEFTGSCRALELSKPKLLKHIAFPGNLLHAAPSVIMFGDEEEEDEEEDEEEASTADPEGERIGNGLARQAHGASATDGAATDGGVSSSRTAAGRECRDIHSTDVHLQSLLKEIGRKRITFLVNIWLNHIPSQSIRCDEELFPKFRTAMTPDLFRLSPQSLSPLKQVVRLTDEECVRNCVCKFVSNDTKYDVIMPLPSIQTMWEMLDQDSMAALTYAGESAIEICYSSDQESSEVDEEEEDEEEELEEEELEEEDQEAEEEVEGEGEGLEFGKGRAQVDCGEVSSGKRTLSVSPSTSHDTDGDPSLPQQQTLPSHHTKKTKLL